MYSQNSITLREVIAVEVVVGIVLIRIKKVCKQKHWLLGVGAFLLNESVVKGKSTSYYPNSLEHIKLIQNKKHFYFFLPKIILTFAIA